MTLIALNKIRPILASYYTILFVGEPGLGLLVLGLTFLSPQVASLGLVSLLSGFALLELLRVPEFSVTRVSVLLNCLLVGLFMGHLIEIDSISVLLTILAGGTTVLVVFFIESILGLMWLPVLSLPFTMVSLVVTLCVSTLSETVTLVPPVESQGALAFLGTFCPSWILDGALGSLIDFGLSFFSEIGHIFCIPGALFGFGLWIAVALFSPLTALFMVFGYGIGTFTEELIFDSQTPSVAFNFSLIFSGLAGYFLVPSVYSMIVALVGTVLSAIVVQSATAFFGVFHVPVTALPFNIVVLMVIRTFRSTLPGKLASNHARTPELALENSSLYELRHRSSEIGVFCPISGDIEGTWIVNQGFEGEWTHQGNWRHALDFVVHGHQSRPYQGEGQKLEDYYAFGQWVLSPVEGTVVVACKDAEDNPVGHSDSDKNWGNALVVRTKSGIHVVLAHLKKDSLKVNVGDTVAIGQALAQVGNSGHSKAPHLHLQVQWESELGGYSLPFHLINYSSKRQIHFHGLPSKGDLVEPLVTRTDLNQAFSFTGGQKQTWSDGKNTIQLTRVLNPADGRFYWFDGTSRIHDAKLGAQYYLYDLVGRRHSFLWDLFLSAPRVPMVRGGRFEFNDFLPLKLTHGFFSRSQALMVQVLMGTSGSPPCAYTFDSTLCELRGTLKVQGRSVSTFCKIDPVQGWIEVKLGDRHYVRSV